MEDMYRSYDHGQVVVRSLQPRQPDEESTYLATCYPSGRAGFSFQIPHAGGATAALDIACADDQVRHALQFPDD